MKFIPNGMSSAVGRQMLKLDASSPKLLFVGGVVGMVGSTVLACRATLKLEEVLEETQSNLQEAKSTRETHPEKYSAQDQKKDTTLILARGSFAVVKLYGPSILLGSVSIAMLTKSHNILQERNAALAAAYAAVDKAFQQYRARVIEKHGEEEDQYFRYGSQEVEVIDGETGKVTTKIRVGDDAHSMYARFFDELSPSWSKEPEYNLVFLRCQQNYANDLLKSRGHVFLNEVYDMLGIPRTKAGQVVGWLIGPEGDNFIDFGIYDSRDAARDFVNGREGSILLDFNVDGIIYDKIGDRGEALSWQLGQ